MLERPLPLALALEYIREVHEVAEIVDASARYHTFLPGNIQLADQVGQQAIIHLLIVYKPHRLALAPVLTTLGAEVRNYSLLLLCMSSALYFLERALRDQNVTSIVYSSLFLYLAILTHYSALWFSSHVDIAEASIELPCICEMCET